MAHKPAGRPKKPSVLEWAWHGVGAKKQRESEHQPGVSWPVTYKMHLFPASALEMEILTLMLKVRKLRLRETK